MSARDLQMPGGASADALVRKIEDAWNLRDIDMLVRAHRIDCAWRDRGAFLWGREQVRAFLRREWRRDREFRLITRLWTVGADRLTIRFACESCREDGGWVRGYGLECWELDEGGLIARRLSNANEHRIAARERVLVWPIGVRPQSHALLDDLGL